MQAKTWARIALATALLASACASQAGELRISTGFDTSSGKYGTDQTTTITSIPVAVAWDQGPWTLKLAVPSVQVEGSKTVLPGVGKVSRSPTTTSTSASGMGDTVASAIYNVYNDPARQLGIDLTGKIKFATADADRGLGTGQNDYTAQVDIYRKIRNVTVFGTLGHAWLGRTPELPLHNVFNAGGGASYKLSDSDAVGATFDWRQKVLDTSADQRELMGFVSHKFDRHWKGQLYVLKGFSDASPDWGGGATVGYTF